MSSISPTSSEHLIKDALHKKFYEIYKSQFDQSQQIFRFSDDDLQSIISFSLPESNVLAPLIAVIIQRKLGANFRVECVTILLELVQENVFYHEVSGDATLLNASLVRPSIKILVHGCSYTKKWGKGFVLAVNKRFGLLPKNEYMKWIKNRGSLIDSSENVVYQDVFDLGAIQIVSVPPKSNTKTTEFVVNMITQKGYRKKRGEPRKHPVRYDAIEKGMNTLGEYITQSDYFCQQTVPVERVCQQTVPVERVCQQTVPVELHMPQIGSGLGGGKWSEIRSIIENMANKFNINTYVYSY
ncbi:MAG: hypothetical protein JKX76_01205 [Colwellia sp.]|nr:hypothetical protein [Colwellia sp.]